MNTRRKSSSTDRSSVHSGKPVTLERSGHRISRRMIDPDALMIIRRLRQQGFTAYLTGGAVQNLMQNVPPKDFDIVTDARPGQIKRRFSNARLIGRRFRLAHIHTHRGKIIEVATFRRPPELEEEGGQDDGSKRKRSYGTPREDAFQRDISINALFYDVDAATVIDYVGGLRDLAAKRIRVIGDPTERFAEDPVRIVRVVRHAARLGFDIERKTERAVFFNRHMLGDAPGARLFEELNKDLALKTRPVLAAYQSYGILKYLLGRAGEDFQADHAMFTRMLALLEIKERTGSPFSREELYSLMFWPWFEKNFADIEKDVQESLKEAMISGTSGATLPKKLRADSVQILTLTRTLLQALHAGRWRKSWESRSYFPAASRLGFMIERGRLPREGESFVSLRRQGARSKRKRRRPRRRRQPLSEKE